MRHWMIDEPADCPVPRSEDIAGLAFTGEYETYTDADTWYLTWAGDGHCYSPYADGEVTPGDRVWCPAPDSETGQARIVGDDPTDLTVEDLGAVAAPAEPYGGRYPCGSLVQDGVWYYGTYCLDREQLNWDTLGPFVGFRISEDKGTSWTSTPHTPSDPLFGESGKDDRSVRFGAPKFVDFGQNLEHSPDGRAYLVGHGASAAGDDGSWITGDAIYLARVRPTPDTINDPDAYEFYTGDEDEPWSDSFDDLGPLIEWPDQCGCVTITYNPGLDRYLLAMTHGWPTEGTMDTMILEAPDVTGPWHLVHPMESFGQQGYFVDFPSKFLSDDGRTAWLCYSHNYMQDQITDPPGGEYAMVLQETKLLRY